MKRVLIFSTAYLPLVGGAEIAIKEVTDRLTNFEFDLVCAKIKKGLPAREKIGGVGVRRVGWGSSFDKLFLIFAGFGRGQYDVVWAVMASWGGLAALIFKTLNPQVRFILTLQEGDDIAARKFGLVALAWRFVLVKADRVTVISRHLGDLARKYGYMGPIDLIPNGVDISKYD